MLFVSQFFICRIRLSNYTLNIIDFVDFVEMDLLISWVPKKIYRLKEDQAFSLSLELGRSEKVAQHPSAEFLLHSAGGGW
jgi:hypothetical protein